MNFEEMKQFDEDEDTQLGRYLTFAVDDEEYGVEIRFVTEIIGMQSINTLPEVPSFVKGVVNLRGKIIPVIDMRTKFGKIEAPYTDRTCIVVVETRSLAAGLIVDQVSDVMVIGQSNIVPPPDVQLPNSHRYVCGIGKVGADVKLLIDCERLFNDSEANSIERIK